MALLNKDTVSHSNSTSKAHLQASMALHKAMASSRHKAIRLSRAAAMADLLLNRVAILADHHKGNTLRRVVAVILRVRLPQAVTRLLESSTCLNAGGGKWTTVGCGNLPFSLV